MLFPVSDQDCINEIHMYFGIKSINDETMSSTRDRCTRSLTNVESLWTLAVTYCSALSQQMLIATKHV